MATERFPKEKYIRQLGDMYYEISRWKVIYAQRGDADPHGWLGGRYDARAAVLDHALQQIVQLRDALYGLPRLK